MFYDDDHALGFVFRTARRLLPCLEAVCCLAVGFQVQRLSRRCDGVRVLLPRNILHIIILAGVMFFFYGGTPAWAVNITIDSTGPSEFSIFAIQLDDVKSIKIQIDYDASTLKSPKVSPTGILLSRSRTQANTASLGTVVIDVQGNEPLIGSGVIATLDFDLVSEELPGKIIAASVVITEENGKSFLAPVVVTNPPQGKISRPKEEEEEEPASSPAGSAPSGPPIVSPPVVPGEPHAAEEKRSVKPGKNMAATVQNTEVVKGVFAGFAELPESRLLEGLRQLIAQGIGDAIIQDPPLALSDGSTFIKVTLRPAEDAKGTPTFIIKGARFVSLDYLDSAWILKLLPHAGERDARVTIICDNIVREYPLTVAPPLDIHMATRRKGAPWNRFDSFVKLVNYLVRSGGSKFSPS